MRLKSDGLIAFTSDASMDFTPSGFDLPLTGSQHAYLKEKYGVDIRNVFWRRQVHGDHILETSSTPGVEEADAFITNKKNLPIAIRTADCVPVFIFDPIQRAIGLAHAGWKGTFKGIAAKTVQRMAEKYGSRPQDLKVALGPGIGGCCYQVGDEFRQYFPDHITDRGGRLFVDIMDANRRQLLEAGIGQENIVESGVCTCCNRNYFSFRRDGDKAGRMISLMMLL